MNPTHDKNFEQTIIDIAANEGIYYGFTPSAFHVQVEEDLDRESVFESAHAEYSFYALVEYTKKRIHNADNAQALFAAVAERILRTVHYTMDVGRWLAVINALLVGRNKYTRVHGYLPINTTSFVMDYANSGSVAAEH